MGALNAVLKRSKPVPCNQCGQPVTDLYTGNCDVCRVINYLTFRHAVGWPLDNDDKKRLGLV